MAQPPSKSIKISPNVHTIKREVTTAGVEEDTETTTVAQTEGDTTRTITSTVNIQYKESISILTLLKK